MRLGFVADVHFQGGVLLPVVAKAWEEAFQIFSREGVGAVYVLGDLHESPSLALGRDATAGDVQAAVLRPLSGFLRESPGREVYVIVGNHDIAGPGHLSSLEYLRHIEGVHVVDSPRVIRHDGVMVGALPWAWNTNLLRDAGYRAMSSSKFIETASELRKQMLLGVAAEWSDFDGLKVLAGHAEIDGAENRYSELPPGETHVFQVADLKATGADVLAFGHYHKRQLGAFVGSLVQLSFGEEGNPTGVAVLDEQGQMAFHEVDCPRYYTCTPEQAKSLVHRAGFDRVKVKYTDRSDLADFTESEGWVFEKQRVLREARTARSEGISVESPLSSLLDAWMKERKPDVPREDLDKALEEMLKDVKLPPTAASAGVGLRSIREVRLRNIGPHRDTVLTVPQDGLMAMVGPNGSGKTTLLEAVAACLWGEFPWYPGALYDRITKGHVGDALLSVTFEAGEKTYRAERRMRTTARTQKTECYLHEVGVAGEVSLAGPKEADFASAVKQLVGDKDFFFATVFQSQGDEGSLIDADPADRMAFARRWVGADRFQVAHQWAKTEANSTERGIESELIYIERLKGEASLADGHREDLVEQHRRKAAAESQVAALENRKADVEAELARLRAEALAREEIARQVRASEEAVASVEYDLHLHRRAVSTLEADLGREPEIRDRLSRLHTLRAELYDAQKAEEILTSARARRDQVAAELAGVETRIEAEVRSANEKAAAHRRDLEGEIRRLESEIAGQWALAQQEAKARKDSLEREGHALKAQIDLAVSEERSRVERERARLHEARTKALAAIDLETSRLGSEEASLKRQLEQAQAKARRLESAGCSPSLMPCPFIADAREAPAELERVQKALDDVHTTLAFEDYATENRTVVKESDAALAAVKLPVPEAVAVDLRVRLEQVRADWKAVQAPDPSTVAVEQKAAVQKAQAELASLVPPDPSTVATDLRQEAHGIRQRLYAMVLPSGTGRSIRSIEVDIHALGNPEADLGRLDAVRESLEEKRAAVVRLSERAKEASEKVAADRRRLEEAGSNQGAIREQESALDKVVIGIRQGQVGVSQIEREIGGTEARLAACREKEGEAHRREEGISPKRARAKAVSVLADFLGPTGVPQILIDSALVPQVNEILADMMASMDEPIVIEFSTQRENKGGGVREGLFINVTDEFGMRDIKEHSFGEQGLQRKLVRQALGLFGAMRQGQHHSVYCVDEPTLGLDARNVPRLLGVIFRIAQRFRQVWVISHDPELLAGIPCRFTLVRRNGATVVDMDGVGTIPVAA